MAYDVSATYSTDRDIDVAPTEIGQFSTFGQFSESTLRELLDEVEKDLRYYPLLERIAKRYYLRIRSRLLHQSGTPNPSCVALRSHLRVFPNGDVPTCQFNSRVVGNLNNPLTMSGKTRLSHRAAELGKKMPRMLGGVRGSSERDLFGRPVERDSLSHQIDGLQSESARSPRGRQQYELRAIDRKWVMLIVIVPAPGVATTLSNGAILAPSSIIWAYSA